MIFHEGKYENIKTVAIIIMALVICYFYLIFLPAEKRKTREFQEVKLKQVQDQLQEVTTRQQELQQNIQKLQTGEQQ